jgi:hypothetical protein
MLPFRLYNGSVIYIRKTYCAGSSLAMARLARSPKTRNRRLIIIITSPPRESVRYVVKRDSMRGESVVKRGRAPCVTVVINTKDFELYAKYITSSKH